MRTACLSVAGAIVLSLLVGLSGVTALEPSPRPTATSAQTEELPDYFPAELNGRPLFPAPEDYSTEFFSSIDSAISEGIASSGGDPATAETAFAVNYDLAGLTRAVQAIDPDDPTAQAAAQVLMDDFKEWMKDGLHITATHLDGIAGMQLLDGLIEEHSASGYSPLVKSTIGERTYVAFDRSGVADADGVQWGLAYPSGEVLFFVWGYGPKASASDVLLSLPDLTAE